MINDPFIKAVNNLINDMGSKIQKSKDLELWERVIRLEGFVNGLQQALILYEAIKLKEDKK